MRGIKPLQPPTGRKEDSENLVLRIKEEIWTKYDALDAMKLGIIKRNCPKSIKDKRKREEAHVIDKKEEPDLRKKKVKDLYDHLSPQGISFG